jgi:hypothetical protein
MFSYDIYLVRTLMHASLTTYFGWHPLVHTACTHPTTLSIFYIYWFSISRSRGDWVTIPACIAARLILLHIIDSSAMHVIVRLLFAEVRTGEVFQLLQLKWRVFAAFVRRMLRYWMDIGHQLLFVHCMSKETLILIPSRLPCACVELECRENSAFNLALCPSVVNANWMKVLLNAVLNW